MTKQHLLRAAAILFAAAAILTFTGCKDKTSEQTETQIPTSVASVPSTQPASTASVTETATETADEKTNAAASSGASVSSGAITYQADDLSEGDVSSSRVDPDADVPKSSSGGSGASSSSAPAATVVVEVGDRTVVIEQGENELPFVAN